MRPLVPSVLLAVLALQSGCSDRRTFDGRFNDTATELEERAARLDRDLEAEQNGPDNAAGEAPAR